MYILNMFVSLNLMETNMSFFRIEKNDLESAVDLLKSWQISRELITDELISIESNGQKDPLNQ